MARASLMQELHLEMKNETGALARVVSALSRAGVSITHLLAYSEEKQGHLQTVTADAAKAKAALERALPNVQVELREVVVVEFENKVGTLAPVTKLLGNHDIFIHYGYGTSGDGFKIVGVFSTADNARAAQLINETRERSEV